MAAAPLAAAAHTADPRVGAFVGGVLHPLLDTSQLLLVLALALWAGQQGVARSRALVITLALSALAALLMAGSGWQAPPDLANRALPVLAAAVAICAALALQPRWALSLVLGTAAGLALGGSSAPELADARARVLALAGSALGFVLLFGNGVVLVQSLRAQWARVALRVAASWVAAASLVVAALPFAARTG